MQFFDHAKTDVAQPADDDMPALRDTAHLQRPGQFHPYQILRQHGDEPSHDRGADKFQHAQEHLLRPTAAFAVEAGTGRGQTGCLVEGVRQSEAECEVQHQRADDQRQHQSRGAEFHGSFDQPQQSAGRTKRTAKAARPMNAAANVVPVDQERFQIAR